MCLVGVHVRLGAAAGLEDDQWKVVVQAAGNHLVGGLHDQPHGFLGQLAEFAIGQCRRLLEDAEGSLDRPPPLEAVDTDPEVVTGTFGLRAPVSVGWNLDGSHAVRFGAERRGRLWHGGIPGPDICRKRTAAVSEPECRFATRAP